MCGVRSACADPSCCSDPRTQGNKPSTLHQNAAKLMRKGTDSKMVREVVVALARHDNALGARPSSHCFQIIRFWVITPAAPGDAAAAVRCAESRLEALGCASKGGSVPMLWGKHTPEEKASMVSELERRLVACSAHTYPRPVLVRALMKAMKNRNAYAKRVSSGGGGDVENIPPTGVPRHALARRALSAVRAAREGDCLTRGCCAGGDNNEVEDALMGSSSGACI